MTPQALYETILASNIINFLIMVTTLVWIFKKFNLGKIVDDIAYDIKNNVTTSAEAVQNALSEYKKAKKESRTTESKKEEIINSAKEVISKLKSKNEEEIAEKEKELDFTAEKIKGALRERKIQKTTTEINEAIYELSVDTIKSMMTFELQEKTIKDSLLEFERIEGSIL